MFGGDRGQVCRVMRHGDGRHTPAISQAQGEMGRGEIGMQIVGDDIWPNVEDVKQVSHSLFEEANGRRIVEPADVLRQESLAPLQHANRVLQRSRPAPARSGHHRPRKWPPARNRAPGGRKRAPAAGTQHRVVAADDDVAVVHQVGISNAGQPFERLVIVDDQRFAMRIGAGHHQQQIARAAFIQSVPSGRPAARARAAGAAVWRATGAPSQARPGAMPGSSLAPFGQSTMGAATLCSNASSAATDPGMLSQRNCIEAHDREGLGLALLAFAQRRPPPRHCAHRKQGENRPGP